MSCAPCSAPSTTARWSCGGWPSPSAPPAARGSAIPGLLRVLGLAEPERERPAKRAARACAGSSGAADAPSYTLAPARAGLAGPRFQRRAQQMTTLRRRATLGAGPAAILAAQATWRLPIAHARGEGGTFVFGRGGDSVRLDPAVITDGESARVTEQIFDTLVMFDGSTTDLKPALARSWDISADALTYTFRLRQGVRFHDGTPFDAHAVKWNFDRWMDSNNQWHKEALAGGAAFEYFVDYTGFADVISAVNVVDDHTVQISLKEPQGPFMLNLALFPFAIISPYSAGSGFDALSRNPVGTGPLRFVEWVPGDRIVLDRFDSYWGEPANL